MVTVVSGKLEVLVYSPADGLPWLRPMFGNAPCPPSPLPPSRSEVNGDNTKKEGKVPKTQSSLLDGFSTAEEGDGESLTSPQPNPRVLLEEALGLTGGRADDEEQSLAHKIFVGKTTSDDKDNAKMKVTGGEVQEKEAGSNDNASNDNGGPPPHSSKSLYWPHEPRYCADVWKYGSGDDDAVARFVEAPRRFLFSGLDP